VTTNDRDTGNHDIWQVDMPNGARARFTSHPANDCHPVWSRDGTELTFDSDRTGLSSVLQRPADGSKPEVEGADGRSARASVRGRLVARRANDGVHTSTQETTLDAWIVPLDDRKPYEIARTTFQEHSQRFSPDGRWLGLSVVVEADLVEHAVAMRVAAVESLEDPASGGQKVCQLTVREPNFWVRFRSGDSALLATVRHVTRRGR
jgi:hypothetical protein